jgi:hypothetical protein
MRGYPTQANLCYLSERWICLGFRLTPAIRELFGLHPQKERTCRGLLRPTNAFQNWEKLDENY